MNNCTFRNAILAGGMVAFIGGATGHASAATRVAPHIDPSGLAPGIAATLPIGGFPIRAFATDGAVASGGGELYVADRGGPVELLDGSTYRNIGSIASSIDRPGGEWVDAQGRLYVANYGGKRVTEYAGTGRAPICVYTSGLKDPINVTTDHAGNVYVVDYAFGGPGTVDVFPQCANTVATHYAIAGGPEGAAIDQHGDLFVSYNAAGQGAVEEFPAGTTSPVALSIPVAYAGGLAIDANQNLLVCDQLQGLVDVVPPPYASVALQYSGFGGAFNVALSGHGKRLFLVDPARRDVVVLSYPSGVRLAVLGSRSGLRQPLGIAASPDTL